MDGIIIISWGKNKINVLKVYKTTSYFCYWSILHSFLLKYSVTSNFPILNSRNKFYKIQLNKRLPEDSTKF